MGLRRERGWRLGLSLSGPLQAETLDAALALEEPEEEEQADQEGRDGGNRDELGEPTKKRPRVNTRRRLFDSVQATYNVLEQAPHNALLSARDAGLDIIIKEALANGRALKCPAVTA